MALKLCNNIISTSLLLHDVAKTSTTFIETSTINNGTPHLKLAKKQNRRAALGRPAIKLRGGGGGGFN